MEFFKDLENKIYNAQLVETQARLDNVTNMLCSLMSRINKVLKDYGRNSSENHHFWVEEITEMHIAYILADPILKAWWEDKQQEQEKENIKDQKQRERIRMRIRTGALMKLTELEKEALGL